MPRPVDPDLLPLLAGGDQDVPRDAAEARRSAAVGALRPRVAVATVEELDAHGVPARCYDPRRDRRAGPPLPAVVWVHGGGFVTGSLDGVDDVCRAIADRAPAVVVSVEYRLAPEHPYPAGLDDVAQAVGFVCATAGELGVDPARVSVGGTSAGATLAAAVCLRARRLGAPSIASQVLVHPCIDDALETPSAREHAAGYGLTRAKMAWYWEQYLPRGLAADPEATPGRAQDLEGLPPALVSLAECDIMRDEGLEYAERLRRAGVAVQTHVWPGMLHGFLAHAAMTPYADAAIDEIAAFVAQS
jgi:acetyl esterase